MESDRSSRLALTPWTLELAVNKKPRETAVSTGPSLELCTYPESLGCAVATDALEQLFIVEKMLQDDYFKCNEEAKAFLKDVAVAVKKLEQMRKDTIDLLEMESMELSRLYFLLRTVPGKFHVELEDCVRDARKLNIFEKNGLQRKIFQLDNEERFLRKRLTELQEVNETLGETQENLAYEHQKIVMELNALLEEKAMMTVSINEIYVKINSAKKLLDLQKQCYKDVTDELERERSLIFQRKQILFDQIYKMKRLHDQKKAETFKMKGKFQALTRKMSEIKDKDTVGTETLTDHNLTILQLQETIKHWRQEVHNLMIFCRNLEEKKIYFVNSKMRLDTERNIEKADLLQKIKKVAEKLKSRRLEYQDLQERLQNLNKQYMAAIKEEEKIKRHQRMMILENEKLLTYITEKENFLFKRKVDIKNMTDGISTLRELLQATKQLYRKELKLLGDKLQREYERRFFTKWKISCAKKKSKLWIAEQSALLEKLINDIQSVQQTRKHLEIEISYKEGEIADFLLGVKELVQKLEEDEKHFVDEENKLIEELTESQKTYVMEKQSADMYEDMLQEYLPNLQEVEVEFINKNKKYEELCGQISAKQEEYFCLGNSISQAAKDFTRFSINAEIVKQELNSLRNQEYRKNQTHFEALKNLENEIYVNDIKTDDLLRENENLRQYIDYMKRLIERYRNKKEQLTESMGEQSRHLKDLKACYVDLWSEYRLTLQELTKEGDEILVEIKRLRDLVFSRDEKTVIASKMLEDSLNDLRAIMEQEVKEKPLEKKKKPIKKVQVPEPPLEECRKRLIEKKLKKKLKDTTMNSDCMNTMDEEE